MERHLAYHDREVSITSAPYSWTAVLACFVHSPVESVDTLQVGFTVVRCSIRGMQFIKFEQHFYNVKLNQQPLQELANGRSSSAFAVLNLCFTTLTK